MIYLFTALALLMIIHALPWIKNETMLIYNPAKISFALSAITTLPYLLIIAFGYRSDVMLNIGEPEIPKLLLQFSIYYSFGLISLLIGINIFRSKNTKNTDLNLRGSSSGIALAIIILSFIFFFALYERISASGGITFVINNIHLRNSIIKNSAFSTIFLEPAAFLSAFMIIYHYGKFRTPPKIMVYIYIFIIFASISIFGGRKIPLFLILFSIFAYSVYVEKIRVNLSNMLLGLTLICAFFIFMLQYRGSADVQSQSIQANLILLISNLSYIDQYIFIQDYFDKNGFWYGASFGDLLIRLGILTSDQDQVPVDDGVYIRTLYQGWNYYPPTNFDRMYPSSWPPESFGNGYLNFGPLGVIGFFLIRGLVVGFCFAVCRSKQYAPAYYFLALFAVFNFHLTNLRIVQFIIIIIPVIALHIVMSQSARIKMK